MKRSCLVSAFLVWSTCFVVFDEAREYCHNQEFVAECPRAGEVVLMESASYGRMKVGPCVKMDFGFVGCSVDVLNHTHERCSGRKSCVIRIPDERLDGTRPCNDDLKSYLEAEYRCIAVVSSSDSTTCKLTVDAENSTGYIASLGPRSVVQPVGPPPPPRRRCGSPADPWVISVPAGQRINITLMDFTSSSADPGTATTAAAAGAGAGHPPPPPTPYVTASSTSSVSCSDLYAFVEEKPGNRIQVCGTGSAESILAYSSYGETVKVVLNARRDEHWRFLLKYEAVGCPDVTQPQPNVWLKRETDRMTAGCVTSGVTWQLVCVGNRWEGSAVNCSIVSSRDARREEGISGLSFSASILIIVGVSLAIGLIVMLLGLYYMKRRRDGLPLGVRSHQLRDMKPLSSDAAYEAAYARNTAFEPVRVATQPRGGCGGGGGGGAQEADPEDDDNEYEYVWDVPSNMVSVVGTGGRRSGGGGEGRQGGVSSRPPDLIGAGGRSTTATTEGPTRCSCLADDSPVKPRSATVARRGKDDGGSSRGGGDPSSTRFASLEWRSAGGVGGGARGATTVPRKSGGEEGKGGGKWGESSGDAVKVCRHCGHSVVDAPAPAGSHVTPTAAATTMTSHSATTTRRAFPAFHSGSKTVSASSSSSSRDAGRRNRPTTASTMTTTTTTLPRSQRH